MIGNDIVDLFAAQKESNWQRKGYLDKIYTASEQHLIRSSIDPDCMVWILWSMKEASYKANNRITGIKEYAPAKINCSIDQIENNVYLGRTTYNNLEYYSRTEVFKEYIHTIALCNAADFSDIKEIIISNHPSNYVDYLKKNNYLMFSERIVKDKFGIPNLFNDITKKSKPISISHHGNFLSLVFIKE
jgi:phosphopantetheinyl transferase (holo-ACP synthase)